MLTTLTSFFNPSAPRSRRFRTTVSLAVGLTTFAVAPTSMAAAQTPAAQNVATSSAGTDAPNVGELTLVNYSLVDQLDCNTRSFWYWC